MILVDHFGYTERELLTMNWAFREDLFLYLDIKNNKDTIDRNKTKAKHSKPKDLSDLREKYGG